eukprot:TRINITY_DN22998_c0_g1_i1.p1 TRINITY_DN22998_c0_g1~~TRINITY_DN22998_c0_g1_i1.p1  ORF type:complete len:586 (-),score=172.53 TRINITY_DN22998_c0_g1_i1:36-1793(-)
MVDISATEAWIGIIAGIVVVVIALVTLIICCLRPGARKFNWPNPASWNLSSKDVWYKEERLPLMADSSGPPVNTAVNSSVGPASGVSLVRPLSPPPSPLPTTDPRRSSTVDPRRSSTLERSSSVSAPPATVIGPSGIPTPAIPPMSRKRELAARAAREAEAASAAAHQAAKQATLFAQFFTRSTTAYSHAELVPSCGSRHLKNFLLVNGPNDARYFMTVTPLGRRNAFKPEHFKHVEALLTAVQHPYVSPLQTLNVNTEKGLFIAIREFSSKGSLRDYINDSNPRDPYNKKYQLSGSALSETKVAKFGKEILEGVDYLRFHNWPYAHLHTGNVLVVNGVCRISEMESDFFGIIPKTAAIITPFLEGKVKVLPSAPATVSKKPSKADLDGPASADGPSNEPAAKAPGGQQHDPIVLAFGLVLFEMAMGFELDVDTLTTQGLPSGGSSKVRQILRRIFEPSPEDGFCTFDELIRHPFFASVTLYSDWVPTAIAVDRRQKQILKDAAELGTDSFRSKRQLGPLERTRSATLQRASSSGSFSSSKPPAIAPPQQGAAAPAAPPAPAAPSAAPPSRRCSSPPWTRRWRRS